MALENSLTDEPTQPVRRVYENEEHSSNTAIASLSKVFRLAYHFDDVIGKNTVLWDDILAAFKDVRFFDILDPLRIAAVPGVTLDVVVTGQLVHPDSTSSQEAQTKTPIKDLSLESLQTSLPNTPQEQSTASSNNLATNTIRRNPAYGLVDEALENYNHIDNPVTAPVRRGPQVILNNQSPSNDENDNEDSKAQHSPNKTQQNARAPQESTSITSRDCAETLIKATLGEKDAQAVVGDMYKDGQGVAQDYQAAMDWYLKAAEQKDPVGQRKVSSIGSVMECLKITRRPWTGIRKLVIKVDAQYNIGLLYRYGRGVPQDYGKAME
ncbi:hypothetical protein BGZ96_004656 [Linnemannia gamsii]|uniref:Sel1 repeat family protein n=1 Tax=Linnemannia gamsii TaxID=64522 RepID=A0ABQ7JI47_9FUNG|nr:hypothetical protein BGZ96_004656 [Linnemannia gamsii]